MGARFRMVSLPTARTIWTRDQGRILPYVMDIGRDRRGAVFELRAPENLQPSLEIIVSQVERQQRHLLLMVRRSGDQPQVDRFLCGHDERDWFVAGVPGGASSIRQAMTALQPPAVRAALERGGVASNKRFLRKNAAFLRQGEWFFIPEPEFHVDESLILRDEPISRGMGKPHRVDELYRTGGRSVYVCNQHPNGLVPEAYRRLLRQNPAAAGWGWQLRKRDPRVYARGAVHHSDHATLVLPVWHRVYPNTENESRGQVFLGFID